MAYTTAYLMAPALCADIIVLPGMTLAADLTAHSGIMADMAHCTVPANRMGVNRRIIPSYVPVVEMAFKTRVTYF